MILTARERGAAAERLAADYLETHGIRVLARNLRCRSGEIDLVCLDAGVLAIVEVRQRAGMGFGGALGSVTARKQGRILRAAGYFLQRRPHWRGLAMRFDVVGVQGLPQGVHRILWIKDAFRAA